ncbi:hypothetical protein [Humibacter ginsenosidimutans]|uniref:Terminase n=1 Tax=Humibacter ginsenosidimutans TaxID=2599293 RepID=A0A5B8M3T4_9MICO|nr:hypothetical protein [Humibacter ginsenosidimutans]QDZ14240.1 hypothetical protein FPZ11_05195 [Humibacter ginsenosidimutans]
MSAVPDADAAPLCACGKPVWIIKTGECRTCYRRRYYREHRAAVDPTPGPTLFDDAAVLEHLPLPAPVTKDESPSTKRARPTASKRSTTPRRRATSTDAAVSETALQPPPVGSTLFTQISTDNWEETRDQVLAPQKLTELAGSDQDRAAFIRGGELLRLWGPRKLPNGIVVPSMLLMHDMLAAGRPNNAALKPRRSTKSTGAIVEALGRAGTREDFRAVVFTSTSGKAGRSRFLRDVAPNIERLYPDPRTDPVYLRKAAGQEAVLFRETNSFVAWASTVDDLRGEAFDFVIIDEAGEPERDKAEEILASAMPTIDTRPGAQIVAVGTGGRYLSGNLLWEWLERPDTGVIRYAAPQYTTEEELSAWEPDDEHPAGHVRELVELTHPGLKAGLTTLENIYSNYVTLDREKFAAEYLGIFRDPAGGGGLINLERWNSLFDPDEELPEPPSRFSMAIAVHPDQTCAAIVGAWRDEKGTACLLVLDHRNGVDWVADRAVALSRKYRAEIAHDTQGPVMVEAEWMQRQSPRPRLRPFSWPMVRTASAGIVKAIDQSQVHHWNQEPLNAAATVVVKRLSGPSNWALGRREREDDITALEAAAMALHAFDQGRPRFTGTVFV